jgi:TonB family protein
VPKGVGVQVPPRLHTKITFVIVHWRKYMKIFSILFLLCVFAITSVAQVPGQKPAVVKKNTVKVEQPVPVKQVQPIYPEEAKKNKIEGTVYVTLTINKEGWVSVGEVKNLGNKYLDKAAVDAAMQWEFKPLSKDTEVTLPFKFKLSDK